MRRFELEVDNGTITDLRDFDVIDGEITPYEGILFITKDVCEIENGSLALLMCNPVSIEVEEGNPYYHVVNNCLIDNNKVLRFACKNSIIPDDGSVEVIGPLAFNYPVDLTEMKLDPFIIPNGVKRIDYRAFAIVSSNKINIIVPESVKYIDLMAFMLNSGNEEECCEKASITILGSPVLETGVFGTKNESYDANYEPYKKLPERLFTNPDRLLIKSRKNSSVIDYCIKYGLSYEEI